MKNKSKNKKAAQWGTPEWILAYPFSKMDRKRRARAIKAVGPEVMEDLRRGPHTCCLCERICEVLNKYSIKLSKAELARLTKTIGAMADLEVGIYDGVFGAALAKAWKLGGSK